MNIQTKLNNESCTLSGELYDLWVTSQESCLNIIHQLCKLIPYSYTMRHSLIISFFNEEFRSQEKNPSLLRWIGHSWQSWGWDSGFLILNSVIFSLHRTPRPGNNDPERREIGRGRLRASSHLFLIHFLVLWAFPWSLPCGSEHLICTVS